MSDDRTPNGDTIPFASLAELQAVHSNLLQRKQQHGETPDLLAAEELLLLRGRAAGMLLDSSADRLVAQSLLNFWSNTLYRAGIEPPDATLAPFDAGLAPELDDVLCPYLGLDAFQETNHNLFFGRQRLIVELIQQLRNHRLLAIVGPSGSGKSSLVRGGLVPELKRGALPSSEHWVCLSPIVPGTDPIAALRRSIEQSALGDSETPQQYGQADRAAGADLSHRPLPDPFAILGAAASPCLLIVDQFEEVFTLCEDTAARQEFIDKLLDLAETSAQPHHVILTMRSDFETFVVRVPRLQAAFEQGTVRVTPMSAAELREAVERPAELVGLKFEAGVVENLLQDILGEPAALPLLQFTLLKLWEQRERNRVTLEAYRRVGGGRLALARSADAFYERLIPEEQVTAKRILLRMVRPGEGLEVTSSRVRRDALYQSGEARERVERVLDKLIAARLVRLTAGDTPGDAQVEVAHEALVRNWPTLVEWLEQEKVAIATRRRLEANTVEWVRLGRGSGGLLDEVQLRDAERWIASPEAAYLGYDENLPSLIQASRAAIEAAAQAREAARQRELDQARALAQEQHLRAEVQYRAARRLRVLATALAVVIAVAVWLAITAFEQRAAAEGQRALAVEQSNSAATAAVQAQADRDQANLARATAVASEANTQSLARAGEALASLEGAPEQALLLSLAAIPTDTTTYQPLVARALYRAFDETLVSRSLAGDSGPIRSVAWNREGRLALTASEQGTVRMWDISGRSELQRFVGHIGAVYAAAWSPDSRQIVSAGADNTVRIWNAASGAEVRRLVGATGAVQAVAWSPDGRQIIGGGADNLAHIWDVASGAEVRQLAGHIRAINAVAWSPDSQQVVTGSSDETARVWLVATGKEVFKFGDHNRLVRSVAWSPDGRQIATGSEDTLIRLWDAVTGVRKSTLQGHTGSVFALTWSPDGRYVLSGSGDTTARIWDAATGAQVRVLRGHTTFVYGVAWSPDARQVLTASQDMTVWDITDMALVATFRDSKRIRATALSPDGQRALTGGDTGLGHIWDIATGQDMPLSEAHASLILSVAWSPDGRQIATASSDGSARVWNAANGQRAQTLAGHTAPVQAVAWSPDGRQIATGSFDMTVRIWDAASGTELQKLTGHTGRVWAVTWSPDGRFIASGGDDTSIRIWDAANGSEVRDFRQPTQGILAVAWSPDGRYVLSGGVDGVARVWNAQTSTAVHVLRGHEGVIWSAAWSPDGRYALTSGADGSMRMWDIEAATEIRTTKISTSTVYSVGWSGDGRLVLSGSDDGAARVWLFDTRLIIAGITDRICNVFTDAEIHSRIAYWQGCVQERAKIAAALAAYKQLRRSTETTP